MYGGGAARADNELASSAATFYVLAPGNDPRVAALAHRVAETLQVLFDRAAGPGNVWVMPRLSWGPNDLGDQCLNDPNLSNAKAPQTLGGMIIERTKPPPQLFVFHLGACVGQDLSANAQMVSCLGTGFKKPTITWVSAPLNGYGSRNGVRIETIGASILAINPANINAVDFAAIALAAPSSASPVPPLSDALTTSDALKRVINQLLNDLNAACAAQNANVKPMCDKLGLPMASAAGGRRAGNGSGEPAS